MNRTKPNRVRPGEGQEGRDPTALKPKVSVIVPHFEDLKGLDLCLTALGAQTYPHDAFEIIVADNASPVGPDAVEAAIAGRARLVVVSDKGAGPARNGGVAAAAGEILAFTDSDCRPEAGWLEGGVEALSAYDFVGGRMRVLVDDLDAMTPTEAFEYVFAFNNHRYVTRKDFTVTANLFCRREMFGKVGGFRVGLSEDVEWSHRAIAAGYRLGYAPAAIVGHPARRTWEDLLKKWKRTNREAYILYASRKYGLAAYLVRSFALPFSAIAHTPRVLLSSDLTKPSQKASAIGVLYRLRFWRFIDAMALIASGDKA